MKEEKVQYSTVDEFVERKVLPELREVVELIRRYMRELAPSVQEMISYSIPAYKGKRILAVISPTKKDITFAFSRGAQFEDKYNLLKGVGKKSNHRKGVIFCILICFILDFINKTISHYYSI